MQCNTHDAYLYACYIYTTPFGVHMPAAHCVYSDMRLYRSTCASSKQAIVSNCSRCLAMHPCVPDDLPGLTRRTDWLLMFFVVLVGWSCLPGGAAALIRGLLRGGRWAFGVSVRRKTSTRGL
jgi:hypothetical protein